MVAGVRAAPATPVGTPAPPHALDTAWLDMGWIACAEGGEELRFSGGNF
jgi:hypothetical protein